MNETVQQMIDAGTILASDFNLTESIMLSGENLLDLLVKNFYENQYDVASEAADLHNKTMEILFNSTTPDLKIKEIYTLNEDLLRLSINHTKVGQLINLRIMNTSEIVESLPEVFAIVFANTIPMEFISLTANTTNNVTVLSELQKAIQNGNHSQIVNILNLNETETHDRLELRLF